LVTVTVTNKLDVFTLTGSEDGVQAKSFY